MFQLLYVPRFDRNGAGPRYRVYQFFDSLQALGIKITDKPLFDLNYLNNLYFKKKRRASTILKAYISRAIYLYRNKKKYDLVFMDGELFPFIPYFIEKLFLPKHYIIDQDDAIFHTYDNHRSWIIRKLLGNKIAKVWKNSHHVIVGNSYIKNKAAAMGINHTSILPTVVDEKKYFPIKHNSMKKKLFDWKDEIIIGWVGSPTTVSAIDQIKPALINLAKKANIVLYIVGAHYHIEGVRTICIDWKTGWNEETEIDLTNQIDIGIMPLEDGPYQRGKGGFKLIKYMACGKPVIASPVGVNVEIVDHGVNGYLATTQEEWKTSLLTLVTNAEQRKQFGLAGRDKMVAKYSYQVIAPVLSNIIADAIGLNAKK